MKTVEQESKEIIDKFGILAKDVVKKIIPECYDGSLVFWKRVYNKICELEKEYNPTK